MKRKECSTYKEMVQKTGFSSNLVEYMRHAVKRRIHSGNEFTKRKSPRYILCCYTVAERVWVEVQP